MASRFHRGGEKKVTFAASVPTLWLATSQDRLFANQEEWLHALYLDALLGKPEVTLLSLPGADGSVIFRELYVLQTMAKEQIDTDLWNALKKQHRVRVIASPRTGKGTLYRWVTKHCFQRTGCLLVDFREVITLAPDTF